MKLEIIESTRHGKRVAGKKKTSTLQVIDRWPSGDYLLKHEVRFTVGNDDSKAKALRKAEDWMADNYGHVHMKDWGKDHWSLLGYVESCCADPGSDKLIPLKVGAEGLRECQCAQLNLVRMRINERRHPEYKARIRGGGPKFGWESSWGTRLIRYFDSDKPEHKAKHLIPSHDDWDCLEDFAREKLLEIISGANVIVRPTKTGFRLMNKLRDFKAQGGSFCDFGKKTELPKSRYR